MPRPTVPYAPLGLTPEETARRASAFYALMDRRRTVRAFADAPVPQAVIEDLIRAASTAPSGAHRQPWFFVAVGDAGTKAAIRAAAEAEERRNYEERFPEPWLRALEPLGTDAHKPYLTHAPWLIAVFAQMQGDEGRNYYVSESVGIAAGLLIAAIHNAGLVCVPHTPSPMKFLKDILGRPRGERAFLLLPVGYPAPGVEVPDLTRKLLPEILAVLPPDRAAAPGPEPL